MGRNLQHHHLLERGENCPYIPPCRPICLYVDSAIIHKKQTALAGWQFSHPASTARTKIYMCLKQRQTDRPTVIDCKLLPNLFVYTFMGVDVLRYFTQQPRRSSDSESDCSLELSHPLQNIFVRLDWWFDEEFYKSKKNRHTEKIKEERFFLVRQNYYQQVQNVSPKS